jgi:iron(II)-dependent oxidoreductase
MTKKRFETPYILHDLPLEQRDTAHFHFDEFAATLARLIADRSTRTPLTIGISGAWGSGKTTLLRRVEEMLRVPVDPRKKEHRFANGPEDLVNFRPCKTVWFDAWKYAEEDELLVALVRVILNAMKKDKFLGRLKAWLENPDEPSYDLAAMFINAFQVSFGGLGAEFKFQLDPKKHEEPSPFKEHTAFFDHFNESFERLLAVWVHNTGKFDEIDQTKGALVIFIDDLDRCLPHKAIQVVEAVKLFFDKKGCIFVIGADKNIIRSAVQKHAGLGEKDAEDYLEKVIQVSFSLPLLDSKVMRGYLANENQVMDADMLTRWETLVAAADVNPRRVKAVVNEVNLQWVMFKNSDERSGEVNRDDFICWQALMRAASAKPAFVTRVMEFEDKERRHSFILDALKWQNGSTEDKERVKGFFSDYEDRDSFRLRAVLKKIGSFSKNFTPESLDALIHLTAPPQKPVEKTAPMEKPEAKPVHAEVTEPEESVGEHPEKAARQVEETVIGSGKARPGGSNLIEIGGIPFVKIPAGKFIMGSKDDNPLADDAEKPQHTLELPEYWMAKFPLTNQKFSEFIQASGYLTTADKEGGWSMKESKFVKGVNWQHPLEPKSSLKEKDIHPVVQVSWLDVVEYVRWFNGQYQAELQVHAMKLHLPTEAQWEKAARGEYGNEWPWGNEFDPARCNSGEGEKGATTSVDAYPQGESPYGVADMVGNVWEWTHSRFKGYPYEAGDGRESEGGSGGRVLRGGSFDGNRRLARCACRNDLNPDDRNHIRRFSGLRFPHLLDLCNLILCTLNL